MAPLNIVTKTANPVKKRKCIIHDIIVKKENKAEPVLVNFANGCMSEDGDDLNGMLYYNAKSNTSTNRVLTIKTPKMKYFGTNDNSIQDDVFEQQIFLGVLDKSTGNMQLVEMSSFNAKPYASALHENRTSPGKALHELSYSEKQERIASGFGSKRSKEIVNRQKQYKVNIEAMSGAMDQAINAASVNKDQLQTEASNSFIEILPPCNKTAGSPEDVYSYQDIIDDYLLEYLCEEAEHILQDTTSETKRSVIAEIIIGSAKLEGKKLNKLLLVCMALYVNYIIKFLDLKGIHLSKDKYPIEGCPQEVQNHIMSQFTKGFGKSRTRSKQLEDKAMCHIFILGLIANKFDLPSSSILNSMRITDVKLRMLMNIVGATYRGDIKTFTLKIPLAKFVVQPSKIKSISKKR